MDILVIFIKITFIFIKILVFRVKMLEHLYNFGFWIIYDKMQYYKNL